MKKIIAQFTQYINFQNLSKSSQKMLIGHGGWGDDDKLVGKMQLKVVKCIQDNNESDLEFVHACHKKATMSNKRFL